MENSCNVLLLYCDVEHRLHVFEMKKKISRFGLLDFLYETDFL